MPTPIPAVWAWTPGAPSVPQPEARYILGGVTLPDTALTTGADLLALADPWLAEALPYYRHCLNRALATQLRAALAGQSTPSDASTAACIEALPVDPAPYLAARALRLPLLCGYPLSATFAERTMHRERMTLRYRFDYLLPALTQEQATRILPMLQAAAGVLLIATRLGASASYQSGRRVWDESGCEQVRLVDATFGLFESSQFAHPIPTLGVTVEVALLSDDDTAAGLPFWGAGFTLDTNDDADNPATLVTTRTEIP